MVMGGDVDRSESKVRKKDPQTRPKREAKMGKGERSRKERGKDQARAVAGASDTSTGRIYEEPTAKGKHRARSISARGSDGHCSLRVVVVAGEKEAGAGDDVVEDVVGDAAGDTIGVAVEEAITACSSDA